MIGGEFAATAVALYVGHHVGDYWIQTDHQARHKGDAGIGGRIECLTHVVSYLLTQLVCLLITALVLGFDDEISRVGLWVGLFISGATHYMADRREHGLMFKLARLIPGKADFMKLGVPRKPAVMWAPCDSCKGRGTSHDASTNGLCWECQAGGILPHDFSDNPQLATGAWALDQSWHIFWGVFVTALVMVAL